MPRNEISNSDSIIDSRDVIKRLEELRDERDSLQQDADDKQFSVDDFDAEDPSKAEELQSLVNEADAAFIALQEWSEENAEELAALESFASEGENSADDWTHGATLIREDHFESYCRELVEDIGDMPKELPSYLVIDWSATAANLAEDYSLIQWDTVYYYVR